MLALGVGDGSDQLLVKAVFAQPLRTDLVGLAQQRKASGFVGRELLISQPLQHDDEIHLHLWLMAIELVGIPQHLGGGRTVVLLVDLAHR